MGLKAELVAAMALPFEDVEVNGVTVRVTGMSAEMQLAMARRDRDDTEGLTFWCAEQCLIDPDTGVRVFGDDDPDLRRLDGNVISDLVNKAIRLSGLSESAKN